MTSPEYHPGWCTLILGTHLFISFLTSSLLLPIPRTVICGLKPWGFDLSRQVSITPVSPANAKQWQVGGVGLQPNSEAGSPFHFTGWEAEPQRATIPQTQDE